MLIHGSVSGPGIWLFEGGFNISSGTVEWYLISYGTECGNSEIASPVLDILTQKPAVTDNR